MGFQAFIVTIFLLAKVQNISGHGRLWEPPSRATMWRLPQYNTKPDYNDNQGFCGGFSYQFQTAGGKCGICGDAYSENPGAHEAPGPYASGILVGFYTSGQEIDVDVELTSNHKGKLQFNLCPNTNTTKDPAQACFENYPLTVVDSGSQEYPVTSDRNRYNLKVKLPDGISCDRCMFQWTYTAGNSWGTCPDGSGELGCGNQETFRACSDISISSDGGSTPSSSSSNPTAGSSTASTSSTGTTTTTTTTATTTTTTAGPPSGGNCHAIGVWATVPGMDQWCITNCNHVPSFCPASHCKC